MNFFPRAGHPEDEMKLRKLTFLRLVIATVIIGAAIIVLQFYNSALSIVALYSLLGVIYLSTGSVYVAFTKGIAFRPLLWLQLFLDIVVLTMIMHFSGGSASYFTILFILPIIVAGIYFQVVGGIATAIAAASAYILYSILELACLVESPSGGWLASTTTMYQPLVRGYLHIAVFFFTGVLSGYASKYVSSKGEELADRERELRDAQLNTDHIIKNMSSGLIVTDRKGRMLILNPAAISILDLDESIDFKGRPIGDVLPHMKSLAKEIYLVLESSNPRQRHELVVEKVDGGTLPLGISISILRGESGGKRGIIALFQDLTEVHRMRGLMRQADRMAAIGELSASIAHEIRAPLASICGSTEMLRGELDLDGDNGKLMDLIISESDRLNSIITDFLEFARLRKPSFTPLNVERCLGDVRLLLEHSPVNEGVSINLHGSYPGLRMFADDEQIRQVFLNIGLNACEAVRRGGTLDIAVEKSAMQIGEGGMAEECVKIIFANDGPAIPDDALPHVFEPFFTTKETGTGLGLSIAARIVESHGGMLQVESSEGSGTVFSVILPVCAGHAPDHEESLKNELVGI